jgi:hypothetical protein
MGRVKEIARDIDASLKFLEENETELTNWDPEAYEALLNVVTELASLLTTNDDYERKH